MRTIDAMHVQMDACTRAERPGDSDGNGVVTFNDITITLANLGVTCQ